MTLLTLPDPGYFAAGRFGILANTQSVLTAPRLKTTQFLQMPGARWGARYETIPLNPRTPAHATAIRKWKRFLAQEPGQVKTFYGFDPETRTTAGTAGGKAAGTLTVAGASQTGSVLIVDGADALETGVLLEGDMLAYDIVAAAGRSLHLVTADTNADSGGQMSIPITPPIRVSPANGAAIIVTDASCVMRLVEDEAFWTSDAMNQHVFGFDAIEVFAESS